MQSGRGGAGDEAGPIGLLIERHRTGTAQLGQNRIEREGCIAVILGLQTVDIEPSGMNDDVAGHDVDQEIVGHRHWHGDTPGNIVGLRTPATILDGAGFSAVRIESDAALLFDRPRIILARCERHPADVNRHRFLL